MQKEKSQRREQRAKDVEKAIKAGLEPPPKQEPKASAGPHGIAMTRWR